MPVCLKRSIGVGVTRFSRCCVSQFPLARKRNSLPPCASQVRQCLTLLQLSLVGLHLLTSTDCPAFPSEMNPVPQLKMQKSPVFCVARAGIWRLDLFLFSHLAPPPLGKLPLRISHILNLFDCLLMVPFNSWNTYSFTILSLPCVYELSSCHQPGHLMVVSDRGT